MPVTPKLQVRRLSKGMGGEGQVREGREGKCGWVEGKGRREGKGGEGTRGEGKGGEGKSTPLFQNICVRAYPRSHGR